MKTITIVSSRFIGWKISIGDVRLDNLKSFLVFWWNDVLLTRPFLSVRIGGKVRRVEKSFSSFCENFISRFVVNYLTSNRKFVRWRWIFTFTLTIVSMLFRWHKIELIHNENLFWLDENRVEVVFRVDPSKFDDEFSVRGKEKLVEDSNSSSRNVSSKQVFTIKWFDLCFQRYFPSSLERRSNGQCARDAFRDERVEKFREEFEARWTAGNVRDHVPKTKEFRSIDEQLQVEYIFRRFSTKEVRRLVKSQKPKWKLCF